jgi:hypothetical protein
MGHLPDGDRVVERNIDVHLERRIAHAGGDGDLLSGK